MPFLDDRNDQLPPLTPDMVSGGPTTGFIQNFESAFALQSQVESEYGAAAMLQERFQENLRRAQELSGEDVSSIYDADWDYFDLARKRAQGEPTSSLPSAIFSFGRYGTESRAREYLKAFDEQQAKLLALKERFPEVKSFQELLDEVTRERKELIGEAGAVSARQSLAGLAGSFAGSVAGGFTLRDPTLLATLPFGGFGRTMATRILTEGAVGFGVELGLQTQIVQPTHEAFGEETTNPLIPALMAGVGAAALRGGMEGAGPAYRAAERRLFPNRARARAIRDVLESNVPPPLTPTQVIPSSRELLERLRDLPDTPDVRAARFQLERDIEVEEASPYGVGREAEVRLARELVRTEAEFEGLPLPPEVSTATAVGRFIRAQDNETVPTFEEALGRAESPEVFARLDRAETAVRGQNERVALIEQMLAARTVADTVSLFDEARGARLREIERALDEAEIEPAARQQLEAEADAIVKSIGPERLAEREARFQRGPKQELGKARKALKAASRRLEQALDEADKAKQAALRKLETDRAIAAARSGEGNSLAAVYPTRTQAVELGKRLDEFEKEVEPLVEGIVAGARQVEEGVPDLVDVGGKTPVPGDLRVPYDLEGNVKTVRELMDELGDDDAMLEAMRTCAI